MANDLLNTPVTDIARLYGEKKLSPVETARACLSQVEKLNPDYNAFVVVADERSYLDAARDSEKRWAGGAPLSPIDGIPVTIKDETDVKGWPTRIGSLTTPEGDAAEDSPCVSSLRKAGAIFLGKTTLPEYGHKGVTDSRISGITRNPWNPSRTAGGSSGGAGVAAATGMGFLHLGSDGGGSIRIPSSFCGVFGIKPSTGTVPEGIPGPFATLYSLGPMAKNVEDATCMLDVITEPDKTNWNAPPYKKFNSQKNLTDGRRRLRIAYAPTINNVSIEKSIARLIKDTVEKMQDFFDVEEIVLNVPSMTETFTTHWVTIAAWLKRNTPEDVREKMDPYLLGFAGRGEKISTFDYVNAEIERMLIGSRIKDIFTKYDLIVMPTMAMTAFETGKNTANLPDGSPWEDWTPLTFLANLTKCPAASVPCGTASDGLPAGIQVMGRYLEDETVMQASYIVEKIAGFRNWLTLHPNTGEKRKDVA